MVLKSDLVPLFDMRLSFNMKHVMCYVFIIFVVGTNNFLSSHSCENRFGYSEIESSKKFIYLNLDYESDVFQIERQRRVLRGVK